MGIKKAQVSAIENGKSETSEAVIRVMLHHYRISQQWWDTGYGSVFLEDGKSEDVAPDDDFVLVPHYNVEGSAGAGALVHTEDVLEYLSFRKDWVRNSLRVRENHLAVINVKGDSMEPRLHDGDVVLLDTSTQQVEDNAIYALQFNGRLSIKRVQRFTSGSVEIISDNPRYKTETLAPDQAEQVRVVGRVVWAGGKI